MALKTVFNIVALKREHNHGEMDKYCYKRWLWTFGALTELDVEVHILTFTAVPQGSPLACKLDPAAVNMQHNQL